MPRDAVKTLFHPFATQVLTPPAEGEKTLFLGAETGFDRPEDFAGSMLCVQAMRPLYRQLERQGLEAQPFVEGEGYDCALVLMTRHRGQNEGFIAETLRRVRPAGLVVVAGSKEDGVQSLRKRLNALGLETEHLAKYHAQAMWFRVPADCESLIAALTPAIGVAGEEFETAAGMFSHGDVDAGSEFLTRYLPKDFRKQAADFGAGWGYLSVALARQNPTLEGIDLFEADHAALDAARRNFERLCPKIAARYHWHDLAREEVKGRYDLIIMNPPFHEGHAAEPHLGQAIIKTASDSLRAGGELLMVANRGLPYEETLKALFKASGETARNARYKILWGRK